MFSRFRKPPKVYSRKLLLQQLEDRIVLDAAVADQNQDVAQHSCCAVALPDPAAAGGQGASQLQPVDQASPSGAAAGGQPLNVVLVSDAVTDAGAIANAAKDNAQVIVFDHVRDNLATLVGKLDSLVQSTGHQLGTVVIVDHGGKGYFNIGPDQITLHNLSSYQAEFEGLRHDLASSAQIQIYACDLAESSLGKDLAAGIALYTGATVFASVDETGGAHGDWDLEYSSNSGVPFLTIIDSGSLLSQVADLRYVSGEPYLAWFHGSGSYAGYDIYNYDKGTYYTKDYSVYWDHRDAGGWLFYNTAAWISTTGLGYAPYGDYGHCGPVNTWFTIPADVGAYSGHQAYLGSGVEYYKDNWGASPPQYWAHYDSGNTWQHYDGSTWRSTTGYEVYPQTVWFHWFQGYDCYDYSGGAFFTKDYAVYWDNKDAGQWLYYNTKAWVTTDYLGDAPYGDGSHYAGLNAWFTVPSGVGNFSGHQAYIGNGVEYYKDNWGANPTQYWGHYDSSNTWQHYDGSTWRGVSGFEAFPQNTWYHTGSSGWDAYDYGPGYYFTKDYTVYWNIPDSGTAQYYNTAAWVTTSGLGYAPYGDNAHYGLVETWFTAPSGVGAYSGYKVYIGDGVNYYCPDLGASVPKYWAYYDKSVTWFHHDGSSWYPVANFGATFNPEQRIEDWVIYFVNYYRNDTDVMLNANVDYIAEHHLLDILNSGVLSHDSTTFPVGWQTKEQRFANIGWTGWSQSQIAENLYSRWNSTLGDFNWSKFTDADCRQQAYEVVYSWVLDDAHSNWMHRYPVMNENGYYVYYVGVAASRGVVVMNFSTIPY